MASLAEMYRNAIAQSLKEPGTEQDPGLATALKGPAAPPPTPTTGPQGQLGPMGPNGQYYGKDMPPPEGNQSGGEFGFGKIKVDFSR